MKHLINEITQSLLAVADSQKAISMQRFFKTGKGEYGEGDIFIGVSVPQQRAIAKQFQKDCTKKDVITLLDSPIHEERLTGVFILVDKFKKSIKSNQEQEWVELYIEKADKMNNWDLVDSSAHHILGKWLEKRERKILYEFSKSNSLWKNRIALVSTLYFIRKKDYKDALLLCELALPHQHDLIHKAAGWMLKEIYEKDPNPTCKFIDTFKDKMPRTMLRYAIEKMPEPQRKTYLIK
jgi:3-methyladenine DNA glycosylase AlkD